MINLKLLNLLNSKVYYDYTQVGLMDMAGPWQLSFADPATPIMEGIINFHNDLMFFIVCIIVFVCWILLRCIMIFFDRELDEVLGWSSQLGYLGFLSKNLNVRVVNTDLINSNSKELLNNAQVYSSGTNHHSSLEIFWTAVPAFILMIISVPSFALLYSIEEVIEPSVEVKVTGHQWFWNYEYSMINGCKSCDDFEEVIRFDSYMKATSELNKGDIRLMEVDKSLFLPIRSNIRALFSSGDVLHAWSVPSLGLKVDACPGRLNQTMTYIKRDGFFGGQCSEICGINHAFMPIIVETCPVEDFSDVIQKNHAEELSESLFESEVE